MAYLGNTPSGTPTATMNVTRYFYTASAGQTVFSGTDDNGNTMVFNSGNEVVTLNGVQIERGNDYTVSDVGEITLTVAASLNDSVNIISYSAVSIADGILTTSVTFTGDITAATLSGGSLTVNGYTVSSILDEDTMSSNSATALATQQSIKAYVDAEVGGIIQFDLDFAGDTGTGTVTDAQSLTIAGTTNEIETSASGQTLTVGLPNDVTIGNNLTVTGDLTVSGTTTTVNTTNLDITDNVITLNNGETGAGVTAGTSGIEVDRGSETNSSLVWDETTDRWVSSGGFEATSYVGDGASLTNVSHYDDTTANFTGELQYGGVEVGYRNIPVAGFITSSHTLTTSDVGKYLHLQAGGSIVIPNSVFSYGDVIVIVNTDASDITITCNTTYAFIAGDNTAKGGGGTVTLAAKGIANVLFIGSGSCIISGNVS